MKKHRESGHIQIQGGKPYTETLTLENIYISYEQNMCSRCGSRHVTTFDNIVTNEKVDGPVSGDLRFGTLVVGKCLNCGNEMPMRFKCIREA